MSEVYERDHILLAYSKWHYGRGLKELLGVAHNFLWFVGHFFSFNLLLKTLFAPWKRLGENYSGNFNLEAFASALIVNTLMRVVGFATRSIILIIGFASYIFVAAFSTAVLVIWFFAPVILLGSAILSATFFVI